MKDDSVNYDNASEIEQCLNCPLPECVNCLDKGGLEPFLKRLQNGKLLGRRYKIWTNSEIQYLKDNYIDKTYRELGIVLGVSRSAIDAKIKELGLCKAVLGKWSIEDDEYLKTHSVEETAEHTGRTLSACKSRVFYLRNRGIDVALTHKNKKSKNKC